MKKCFKKETKLFELRMMTLATEGCYAEPHLLDHLWADAEELGKVSEILNAKNDQGDNPLQLSARYGNPRVLSWIVKKWEDVSCELDIDAPDSDGASPLFACCQKGYLGAELIHSRTPETKRKRWECAQILIKAGANVNYKIPLISMTPLHWAAYNDDSKIVYLLLSKGAIMAKNREDNMPVDIAGFCGNGHVVNIFAEQIELNLDEFVVRDEAVVEGEGRSAIMHASQRPIQVGAEDDKNLHAKMYGNTMSLDTAINQRQTIKLIKVSRVQLKDDIRQEAVLRTMYWCAFYGRKSMIELMIINLRWSPFIKSFKAQNCLTAAVRGKRIDVVKYICSFNYTGKDEQDIGEIKKSLRNKDVLSNTAFHYAYAVDSKEIRVYLKEIMANNKVRNMRGYLPKQLRHQQKIDSDDSEDQADKDAFLASQEASDNVADSSSSTSSDEEEQKSETERKRTDVEDPNETRKAIRRKALLHKHADYCFVTTDETFPILKTELDPLVSKGGVFYDKFISNADPKKILIVVYFEDQVIDFMAEILNMKARLTEYDCMVPFKCYAAEKFERFNSRQLQSIILNTFESEFDIAYLEKSKVILDHFPMHTQDREHIETSWQKYRWRLAWGFVSGDWEDQMQPLSFIADYYGEKFGFYFAWLVHYTGFLLMPSIAGLVLFIRQLIGYFMDESEERNLVKSFDTMGNVYFAIFIALWCTIFVESWKRKQNMIANKWLMRDFQDPTTERPEFKASLDIDTDTKSAWKVIYTTQWTKAVLIGFPVTLFFMSLVLVTQIAMRWWYLKVTENDTINPPFYIKYAPASINATCIIIYGIVYKTIAFWLVDQENHRYTTTYENSIVSKIYLFQFVNSYISCFILAFWSRKTELLSNNLITILAFKQIGFNLIEYAQYRIINGMKIKKVRKVFEAKINEESDFKKKQKLRLHQSVEEQLCMKKERDTLVFFYNEAIVQLGFICLFSTSFPLAALFSVMTNLLEIKTKLNSLGHYSRRFMSEGANGIGNWTPIMEFVSMICIPVNIAVVYFTGANGEKSEVVKSLEVSNSEYWTIAHIILLVVAIEHGLLFLKIAIATAISDVPKGVVADEFKRMKIMDEATKELLELKVEGDHETYDEILAKIQADLDNEYKENMYATHVEFGAKADKSDEDDEAEGAKEGAKEQKKKGALDIAERARKYFIDKRNKANRKAKKELKQRNIR